LSELEAGTRFQPVLADPIADENHVKRVILLSGKIYYDLIKERQTLGLNDCVAFVRIEELSPFPFKQLEATLKRYNNATEYFYLQEEPKNQGAYTHVSSRIKTVLEAVGHEGGIIYKGRTESALPAPGIGRLYTAQQKAVIDSAFEGL
jgi:probable 2-oxoglutarate dehydrogenase E1 component DHKTD1